MPATGWLECVALRLDGLCSPKTYKELHLEANRASCSHKAVGLGHGSSYVGLHQRHIAVASRGPASGYAGCVRQRSIGARPVQRRGRWMWQDRWHSAVALVRPVLRRGRWMWQDRWHSAVVLVRHVQWRGGGMRQGGCRAAVVLVGHVRWSGRGRTQVAWSSAVL